MSIPLIFHRPDQITQPRLISSWWKSLILPLQGARKSLKIIMQLLWYYKRDVDAVLLKGNVQISANSGKIWCGEDFREEVTIESGLEQ